MAAAGSAQSAGPRTYGNWRRPTTSGLFGLGSLGTGIMLVGLILTVLVTMVGGLVRGLVTFLLLVLCLATILVRDGHGKNLLDRGLARVAWGAATRKGAHLYRSGPLGFALWGTHQLPGIAAQLRLSEHTDSYGRRFALIYAPTTRTYTAVIATEPDGAGLVDPEQVDVWVADWGHWLANLADEPGIEACAVTIETAPDTGHRLRREVEANVDPDAPDFARAMLREVVDLYPAGSSVIKAYVTLTFSAVSAATGKRRSDVEMGRDLASRLPGLTGGLSSTGAGAARPLSAGEVCDVVRVAYNPGIAPLIDEAHAEEGRTDFDWVDVGPVAAEAEWAGYRHDDAYSVTWSMTTAPRGNVQSAILARLLAPHRDVARKRVTLLYRPIDAAKAAAIVEADLRAAQFVATSTTRPSAREVLATRSAAATAQEEAAGAGLVNFGMLVTATTVGEHRVAEAKAAVDNLAATARLRLRPVYGGQAAAFAAALPLGLVLPKHLKVPSSLKDRL
ncbi:SCO6880 family protein [Arsenicicoccus bolidensis]|uniref:SCO6880 family protein n=1 Tax=Arsenicicoccus bolidensis TaxID=229480 RepID=UPI0004267DAF|nr:SCO6880 family protein [Arsenicicoccus bolidensis]